MILIKRLVLDVLKPREPNTLDFAKSLADLQHGYLVTASVVEVDDKTETIVLKITGNDIQFDKLSDAINELGGSLHSIDEVEVLNTSDISAE